jgi:hypothetical protein
VDAADRAELDIELELEAAIAAARGVKPDPRRTCHACGESLPGHRQEYGTCWACQCRIEARQRRELVGV